MSISPQSLARTRDKRSHKTPARFDDFIPPEATYRNVAEALKFKGSRNAKRHASLGDSIELRSQSQSVNKRHAGEDQSSSQSSTSASERPPPYKKTILSDKDWNLECKETIPTNIELKNDLQPEGTTSNDTSIDTSASTVISTPDEPPASNSKFSKAATTTNGDKHSESLLEILTKNQVSGDEPASNKDALENFNLEANVPTKIPQAAASNTLANANTVHHKPDDSCFKKSSPFHPSITISNGVRLSGSNVAKPLIEKKTSAPSNNKASTNTSKPLSRKKTKGLSLMIRASPNASNHDATNPQLVHRQVNQSQQMLYSNLNQNMQYGSRLMLNEPIQIPKSVGTIAPITTTLQQIVNQARKPPFISKKAEAYIAYQDARKFEHLTSTHKALVRITETLSYHDRINLRCVNRTWKSIIDSDAVWERVTYKLCGDSFKNFVRRLKKYKTKECVLEYMDVGDSLLRTGYRFKIMFAESEAAANLKKLTIKSAGSLENRYVMEMLCYFNNKKTNNMLIVWKVKVAVDECGHALVPIRGCGTTKYYSDKVYYEPAQSMLVEISELEDHFNGGKKDLVTAPTAGLRTGVKPVVHIEPI